MKKMGVSPLSNKIYIGNTRKDKKGVETWTTKEDITDEALRCVFEYMYNEAKETGSCGLTIDGYGQLIFTREKQD